MSLPDPLPIGRACVRSRSKTSSADGARHQPFLAGAAVGRLDVSGALESDLARMPMIGLGFFYAPFDYLEAHASIAIVGVTPGPTQAFEAIRCARDGLRAGLDHQDVQASVKHMASFKGMRRDLASWFDAVGLADVLGRGRATNSSRPERAGSFTRRRQCDIRPSDGRKADGRTGTDTRSERSIIQSSRAMVVKVLGPELRALSGAVIVPLGKERIGRVPLSGRSPRPVTSRLDFPASVPRQRAPSPTLRAA